eukprot:3425343-Amphidinium_carterae.1
MSSLLVYLCGHSQNEEHSGKVAQQQIQGQMSQGQDLGVALVSCVDVAEGWSTYPDPARDAQRRRMAVAQKRIGIPQSTIDAIMRRHYLTGAEPEPMDTLHVAAFAGELLLCNFTDAGALRNLQRPVTADLVVHRPESMPASPRLRGPVRSPPANLQRPVSARAAPKLPENKANCRPMTSRGKREKDRAAEEDLQWLCPVSQEGPKRSIDPDLEAALIKRLDELSLQKPGNQ